MIDLLPDALADALGLVVSDLRREWKREIEAIGAQSRVVIAELRAEVVGLREQIKDRADLEIGRIPAALSLIKDGKDGNPGPPADTVEVERLVAERVAAAVAALPPAVPGKNADPALMAEMVATEVAKLPPAEPGRSIDPEQVREFISAEIQQAVKLLPVPADGHTPTEADLVPLIEDAVSRAVRALPVPADGHTPTTDELAPVIEAAVIVAVSALPKPLDGEDGKSVAPEDVERMVVEAVAKLPPPARGESGATAFDPADVERMVADAVGRLPPAEKGDPGENIKGDTGPEGPPGKMPIASDWQDRVHYAGAVVVHAGASFQAIRDTGREPPHADWLCIAAAGRDGADGRSFVVRGTWHEDANYRALDVVALNGASFVARHDEPGVCPGEGWQLSAGQGKQGKPGDRGAPGAKGDRGDSGPPAVALQIDDNGLLSMTNGDGSLVTCDFYPLLIRAKV